MRATLIPVRVDHDPVVHQVQTRCADPTVSLDPVPFVSASTRAVGTGAVQCTLLELVQAIGDVTADDREVIATVIHLLESGQVRLCGNFRGQPVTLFRNG